MSKNMVLCCDGTGNGFDNPENDSNVVKLYNTLAIGPKQIAYYHPGVGTMGAPNARNRLEQMDASQGPWMWFRTARQLRGCLSLPDQQVSAGRSHLSLRVQPRCLYGAGSSADFCTSSVC